MTFNIAYVFPGQGSQSVGMLAELGRNYALVTDLFLEVSDCLGYDLWALAQEGPESQLNQTEYTQVVMLVADVAIFQLLQSFGAPKPYLMAGHSLGEYAALVCAKALSLSAAAQLVQQRGRLMQAAIPEGQGAMAAIVGLSDEQVIELCAKASMGQVQVTPANFNAIGQVVIAGHTQAVLAALQLAEGLEARLAKIIPVSVPCHCNLLRESAEGFAQALDETLFAVPTYPVISNVDLSEYQSVEQIRTLLKQQLYQPVRWVETIQQMSTKSTGVVIESGPGKVLSGLIKRIDKEMKTIAVHDEASLQQALEFFRAL